MCNLEYLLLRGDEAQTAEFICPHQNVLVMFYESSL